MSNTNISNHDTQQNVVEFIKNSYHLKPNELHIDELKWKYLVRSVIRGKNILMCGPSGCGKTFTAQMVQLALKRKGFYFNLGATQDPRSTLIGNTHFKTELGTIFNESLFVRAIRTPNAIILLDELTRAHPDAWNILMTVLDYKQRYLRLDEKDNCETVPVADGVSFIATANIGSEYTATRVIDRALLDRFVVIEVPTLNVEQESKLLKQLYPDINGNVLKNIASIAYDTRNEINTESSKISNMISTRMSIEMAGLINDGFSFMDAAEICILPFFTTDGGNDSERSYIKKIIQQYNINTTKDDMDDSDLFNFDDIENAFEK